MIAKRVDPQDGQCRIVQICADHSNCLGSFVTQHADHFKFAEVFPRLLLTGTSGTLDNPAVPVRCGNRRYGSANKDLLYVIPE